MKKLTLSLVTVLAMSTFAIAGGDIAPVEEPMVEVAAPVVDDSGFYIGAAYSYMGMESIEAANDNIIVDANVNSGMLQAGYKFNAYVAAEARYWFGGNEDTLMGEGNVNVDVDSWGIYVKPMYPLTDVFDIYALLGYASSTYDMVLDNWGSLQTNDNQDGFSWGIGLTYAFNDNVSIFADYVSLYDDSDYYPDMNTDIMDTKIDTINFGVTYKF